VSTPDDPERLADAASQSQLGQLFVSAARDLPSDAQLARLAAKLGPVLDAPPGAPPAAPGTSLLVKAGIAAGTVALLVGTGLSLRRSSDSASVPRPIAHSVAVPVAETAPTQPPAAPAPSPAAEPVTSASDAATAPAQNETNETAKPDAASPKPAQAQAKALSEAALLEQARRELSSSPNSALLLANQHRARFPRGALTQEREVIAIEALRRLHRTSEADQRAANFGRAFPGSAHRRMVDEAVPK
jgi:hypothetical protein